MLSARRDHTHIAPVSHKLRPMPWLKWQAMSLNVRTTEGRTVCGTCATAVTDNGLSRLSNASVEPSCRARFGLSTWALEHAKAWACRSTHTRCYVAQVAFRKKGPATSWSESRCLPKSGQVWRNEAKFGRSHTELDRIEQSSPGVGQNWSPKSTNVGTQSTNSGLISTKSSGFGGKDSHPWEKTKQAWKKDNAGHHRIFSPGGWHPRERRIPSDRTKSNQPGNIYFNPKRTGNP